MTKYILPGGTDVAEMALFDAEAVPARRAADLKHLDELAEAGTLIRLQTGSDGGYLLHLYVDEDIPPEVMQYCVSEEQLSGKFRLRGKSIAFGGLESAFQGFKPNPFIRSDATLVPGEYEYVVYQTDIPVELIDAKLKAGMSAADQRYLAIPGYFIPALLILMMICGALGGVLAALGLGLLGFFALRVFLKTSKYRALKNTASELQLEFPSMVMQMRS